MNSNPKPQTSNPKPLIAAAAPEELFGENQSPGVLVVDRYRGYNQVPCPIQDCYAHLLREVQNPEKEFPGPLRSR